ncbi:MAG: FAD-linked oxidase C-terminal domain-containing protein [Bacillota bacterium]
MNSEIMGKLEKIVGRDDVLVSRLSLEMYAYDSSPFIHLPEAVVFPKSTAEVSEIMKLANKHNFKVVPRGAGTCLSGGAVPIYGGIVMALTKMDKILDIDIVNETALVESGVINLRLQQALDPLGYMFAPDPASQKVATIGGNVAECAGGIKGVKFGVTKEHVLGMEVVLPTGEVVMLGKLAGSSLSPNLMGIFNGSEGTLGIITRVLVKLTKKPEDVRTMMAVFASLDKAGETVSTIISRGIVPTTLEIMDQTLVKAVDDFLNLGLPRNAEALLLIEVDGHEIEVDSQIETIVEICLEMGAAGYKKAENSEERESLWLARRSGNGALGRIKPAYMVQDITVPRSKLPEMFRLINSIGKKYSITIAQMAHAGDGNLHPHLLYDPADQEEYHRVELASEEIFKAALDLEGCLTGEHGIGMEKLKYMSLAFSEDDLAFKSKVKKILDPNMILNPGKVLNFGPDTLKGDA